jgi:nucleotide-binding universal stress UspA family protein
MTDFKRVLVPIDLSLGSRVALQEALTLARRFDARLEVIHVWEPEPVVTPNHLGWLGTDADAFWRNMSGELRRRVSELLLEEAPELAPDITIHVEAGYVVQSLLKHIEQGNHDLVVMGTHGRTGLGHFVLGSVAERVVRMSPVPVLTVRVPKEPAAH